MNSKFFLFVLSLISSQLINAQERYPILNSNIEKCITIEDNEEPAGWWLTPQANPDVFLTSKTLTTKTVTLKTDVDSITVELKPGQTFDFAVLFNGDTCRTRFKCPEIISKYADLNPPTHDTIPFWLTDGNNIIVQAVLNESDTINLNFDSGSHQIRLMEDSIVKKTNLLSGQPGVKEGTAKPNFRRIPSYNTLEIGNLTWDSLRVGATKAGGQGSDGRFAWDILDGRVIEIDYDKNLFIVHSSLSDIPNGYFPFEMIFAEGFMHIKGEMVFGDQRIESRFLFDGGYQRSVLLDPKLMKEQKFPENTELIKSSKLTNSSGVTFETKVIKGDKFSFGSFELTNIPVQLLPEGLENPAGIHTHFLGNELLKRFNTILDLKNHIIYLQPNTLYGEGYADLK